MKQVYENHDEIFEDDNIEKDASNTVFKRNRKKSSTLKIIIS